MDTEHFYDQEDKTSTPPAHYYGDIIRALFVAAGALMIVSLPFFKNQIPVDPAASIFFILILGVLAGFSSPRQKWVPVVNTMFSLFSVLVFEYYAMASYKNLEQLFTDPFFLVNQVLACIFFVTLYLSVKTMRAAYFD
jgi:hypothetical protein